MEKELKSIFDVGYDYIRKIKLELEELQKEIDKKKEKVKLMEQAIVIMNEDSTLSKENIIL